MTSPNPEDPNPPRQAAAPLLSDAAPLDRAGLLWLVALAILAGALTGLIGAVFRWTLETAGLLRDAALLWAGAAPVDSLQAAWVIGGAALACALAAWMVRRIAPLASGSGIPHVEAVLRGAAQPAPLSLLPVKFLGGTLVIGSGLALGREGPSVQMGASIGHALARLCRRPAEEQRSLLAACAGAGLATAFNAPFGGAVFVLEELVQRFEHRTALAALIASASAILVARWLLGAAPVFPLVALPRPPLEALPLFAALGLGLGLLAVLYNKTILGALALADGLRRVPVELRAGLIGAAVAAIGVAAPWLIGGGDGLTEQALRGQGTLALLPLLLIARWVLGAASYAAGTPGGLFAPLLVLGAEAGLIFGLLAAAAFPTLGLEPAGFALVGMAAFFAGVVRAPLTGMILVTEMTLNDTLLLPMLAACGMAILVAMLLRDPPIYEALADRAGRRAP
jgi:CIC family chloride channel protein